MVRRERSGGSRRGAYSAQRGRWRAGRLPGSERCAGRGRAVCRRGESAAWLCRCPVEPAGRGVAGGWRHDGGRFEPEAVSERGAGHAPGVPARGEQVLRCVRSECRAPEPAERHTPGIPGQRRRELLEHMAVPERRARRHQRSGDGPMGFRSRRSARHDRHGAGVFRWRGRPYGPGHRVRHHRGTRDSRHRRPAGHGDESPRRPGPEHRLCHEPRHRAQWRRHARQPVHAHHGRVRRSGRRRRRRAHADQLAGQHRRRRPLLAGKQFWPGYRRLYRHRPVHRRRMAPHRRRL